MLPEKLFGLCEQAVQSIGQCCLKISFEFRNHQKVSEFLEKIKKLLLNLYELKENIYMITRE